MNLPRNRAVLLFLMGLYAFPVAVAAQDAGFRFLATGDLPYSQDQEFDYRWLLRQSESEQFDFLLHVGDFKAQSVPCTDDEFRKIRSLFQEYPKPIVYTPGDNDWTDCHEVGSDPVERLDRIRELFFEDPNTLRLSQLKAKHQSRDPKFAKYIENYRFAKSGVMFIVVHVVGSRNNKREDNPDALQEYADRSAANTAFLEESFAEAIASDAAGVVTVIHANPDFEKAKIDGFFEFLAVMRGFLTKYRKPVVCIHGDSHYYRIDKPFKDESDRTYLHFTRMEVFGSPNVAGVVVSVDPSDPQIFSYRPYFVKQQSVHP